MRRDTGKRKVQRSTLVIGEGQGVKDAKAKELQRHTRGGAY